MTHTDIPPGGRTEAPASSVTLIVAATAHLGIAVAKADTGVGSGCGFSFRWALPGEWSCWSCGAQHTAPDD
ncbi:hypothetical protein GT204_06725 [Streptomyces sp. SID4919]|uniref:hypothetical protein n=1 Tax=unclassified Streptomyces TaxID=2593676 RepID=UPI0011827E84|nr:MULTISPECIES: hypothetical protein [unclassified Streptomyces]MYY08610.1 hypothetical protein [Streptomyces sp. SID4919]